MAYDIQLADKLRAAMAGVPNTEEKHMFGGVCFMVDHKMCIGISKNELMCRTDPDRYDELMQREGCRQMDFTGKPMKGYHFVSGKGLEEPAFSEWVALCLDYNKTVQPPKKKAAKKK
jgi:TfoX N-terminal domain